MKTKILISFLAFFYTSITFALSIQTNYENVPVSRLVPIVSDLTQKSFTYSPDVQDVTISLVIPKEKSLNEIYQLFKKSLKASGLKIHEQGGLVTIVSKDNFEYYAEPFTFKTFVVPLKSVKSSDLIPSIQHLVSYDGTINSVGDYLLVINDSPKNFLKVKSLISNLDNQHFDPVLTKIITLNNITPSLVKPVDGVTIEPYDSLSRLQITAQKSKLKPFVNQVLLLDNSLKTLTVRMLIVSISKTDLDTFNIVPILSNGQVQLTGSDFQINTFSKFKTGISLLFDFLKSSQQVTIHSQPFLQLLEGEQASFNIGREVPVKTSQIVKDSGQIIENIERKKIGLSVDVKASLRPDGDVYLTLNQNFSSISETQLSQVSDVITDDQSITTTMRLKPSQVYAVGGLIDNRKTSSTSTIPFLEIDVADSQNLTNQELFIFVQVDTEQPSSAHTAHLQ